MDDASLEDESANQPISTPVYTVLACIAVVIAQMDDKSGAAADQEFLQTLERQTELVLHREASLTETQRSRVRRMLQLLRHRVSRAVGEYGVYDAEDDLSIS